MSPLAPLPVAVPLAAAALLLVLRRALSPAAAGATALAGAVTVMAVCVILVHRAHSGTLVYWFGGWTPRQGVALGISFAIDALGAGAAAFCGLVVAVAVLVVRTSADGDEAIVHALLMVLLAAMAGFCLTGDLFNLFVFFELMAVSAFGLAAYRADQRPALGGALNFAVTNTIGAFLVLIGIALLYGRTGALNLAQIGRSLASPGQGSRSGHLVVLAFALVAVGFLIKAAIVPFHFWLIATASSAPLPLTVVLAGALDLLGLFALARVYWSVFATPLAPGEATIRGLLLGLGVATALIGAVLSLATLTARRVLAFVMVSHAGILLLGIGSLTPAGLAGAAVYAVGDGTVKAALFVIVASCSLGAADHAPGTMGRGATSVLGCGAAATVSGRAIGTVGGRATGTVGAGATGVRPGSHSSVSFAPAFLLACGGLAIAGLPLFGTGVGKIMMDRGLARSGYAWLTPAVVLASLLTGAAVLRLAFARRLVVDPASEHGRSVSGLVVAGLLLVVSVTAAFALDHWASTGAARFMAGGAYQAAVLDGRASGVIPTIGAVHLDSAAVGLGLGTAVLAVALAVLWDPARRWLTACGRHGVVASVRAASGGLLRLHGSSIGDSAFWVTLGTAGVGLVLALRIG